MENEWIQWIEQRHSVRRYKQIPIEPKTEEQIQRYVQALREESGLDIRFCRNAEDAFGGLLLKCLGWNSPPAYVVFVGEKTEKTQEQCGYYGEKLVLLLQSLGLNTCWVGMFDKQSVRKETEGEGIITIAVGYGETNGKPRKSKPRGKLTDVPCGEERFDRGMECARMAPTAINQQKFFITRVDGQPYICVSGSGPFVWVDLGIVRCHFELGSGLSCRVDKTR